MIITTKPHHPRYILAILLTILGWIAFFFLFGAGIVDILIGEMSGPDAPWLPPLLLDSVNTILSYIVFVLAGTLLLIIWAQYNQRRFFGKDRRKFLAPLSREEFRARFGLSDAQLDTMRHARIITIHHEDDGTIRAIDIMDKEKIAQKTTAQDMMIQNIATQNMAVQNTTTENVPANSPITQNMIPEAIRRDSWPFLHLRSSAKYIPSELWGTHYDFYGFYSSPTSTKLNLRFNTRPLRPA